KYSNLNPQLMFWRQISLLGSTMGSDRDFQSMLDFVNTHKIKPVVDQVFELKDGPKAFARMEAGAQFGKIVIQHP
ncbi:MAG: zinc-binding dehydrogenase, partial [Saprospiraceae bacterium]|nr:zinc-binding dehydrogenase [Saprospiraceae bacterium]